MGNSGCFYGESQLRQSRATQCTVHAGCFGGGGGGFFLTCEVFGRMFDNLFPACALIF